MIVVGHHDDARNRVEYQRWVLEAQHGRVPNAAKLSGVRIHGLNGGHADAGRSVLRQLDVVLGAREPRGVVIDVVQVHNHRRPGRRPLSVAATSGHGQLGRQHLHHIGNHYCNNYWHRFRDILFGCHWNVRFVLLYSFGRSSRNLNVDRFHRIVESLIIYQKKKYGGPIIIYFNETVGFIYREWCTDVQSYLDAPSTSHRQRIPIYGTTTVIYPANKDLWLTFNWYYNY